MGIIEVFPWNANLETGILQIDDQHQRLVSLLNMLASHLASQADRQVLDTIFNELFEYTCYHFETEESIWRQFFIEADEWQVHHQQEHQNFIEELLRLKGEENVKIFNDVAEDLLSFLTHWLAFHILDSDKRMAKTVLAMLSSNMSLEQAKESAALQMGGATRLLIETILHMYDSLSSRTLQLMREITERQQTEEKLRLAANVFDHTLDAICITDADFKIVDANPSFYKITDLAYEKVIRQKLCLLETGLLTEKQFKDFSTELSRTGHWSGLVSTRHKDGEIEAEWLTFSVVKTKNGIISHYVAIFSNVSRLIAQQQTLEKVAHHDVLTGLPNRLLLQDRLKLAIAHAERTNSLLAVCYLDLDGFKPVNDQLGHIAGDYLLQEVAKRFLKNVRSCDTVARLGGDEFVILLGDLNSKEDCAMLLERVLAEISQQVYIQDTCVKVSASIGVTFFPADKSDAETLLHHADQTMYQAKRLGKSRFCFYDSNQ